MSVWLTPDLKPVYGGTYFPPNNRYFGQPGFPELLVSIASQVCAEVLVGLICYFLIDNCSVFEEIELHLRVSCLYHSVNCNSL